MAKNDRLWEKDEDKELVEIVLAFLRKGKTRDQAYIYACKRLGRKTTACMNRWQKIKHLHVKAVNKAEAEGKRYILVGPSKESASSTLTGALSQDELQELLKSQSEAIEVLEGELERSKMRIAELEEQLRKQGAKKSNGAVTEAA